jgi:hypothetical protein
VQEPKVEQPNIMVDRQKIIHIIAKQTEPLKRTKYDI